MNPSSQPEAASLLVLLHHQHTTTTTTTATAIAAAVAAASLHFIKLLNPSPLPPPPTNEVDELTGLHADFSHGDKQASEFGIFLAFEIISSLSSSVLLL